MIHIYFGENDYSRREALEELKADLGPPDMLETNTSTLRGQDVTPDQLLMASSTVPFLGPRRLVVVEGFLGRWEERDRRGRKGAAGRRKDSSNIKDWQSIADSLQAMPETTALVFVDGLLKKQNAMLKLLSPLAEAKEFTPLRGSRLNQWIQHRASKSGSTITPEAVRRLAYAAGGSLWALAAEIDKLSVFALNRPIDEEDVERLVAGSRESNIFALVDAVVEGRPARACLELDTLYRSGASSSYVMTMLARQYRMLTLAKDLERRGGSRQDIGRAAGLSSDYALGKVLDQAAVYRTEELKGAYRQMLQADLAFKSGELPEKLSLELLVIELAQSRVPARRTG